MAGTDRRAVCCGALGECALPKSRRLVSLRLGKVGAASAPRLGTQRSLPHFSISVHYHTLGRVHFALRAINDHARAGLDQMVIDRLPGFVDVMDRLTKSVTDRVLVLLGADDDRLAVFVLGDCPTSAVCRCRGRCCLRERERRYEYARDRDNCLLHIRGLQLMFLFEGSWLPTVADARCRQRQQQKKAAGPFAAPAASDSVCWLLISLRQ